MEADRTTAQKLSALVSLARELGEVELTSRPIWHEDRIIGTEHVATVTVYEPNSKEFVERTIETIIIEHQYN